MTLVTRVSAASLDASTSMVARQIPGVIAGAAIDGCAPCYIASDGLAYMSNATGLNEAAKVHGWNGRSSVSPGQPVTLFGAGVRMRYATGLTPGQILYVGETAGRLDTAPTVGDPVGAAIAVSATDIITTREAENPESVARLFLATGWTLDSATAAALTGFAKALAAGTYEVDFWLSYLSADASVGIKLGASLSAGFSAATLQVGASDGAGAMETGAVVASGGTVAASGGPTTKELVTMRGVLVLSAAGTLTVLAGRSTDVGDHDLTVDRACLTVRKIA